MIRFNISPSEYKPFRLLVELDLVSYHRFDQKRTNAPDLVSGHLPMYPIERVRGIPEIIPGNQPATAKIHGESPEMQVGAKAGSETFFAVADTNNCKISCSFLIPVLRKSNSLRSLR